MIKNLKDLVIIILTGGVLVLLGVIIIGDYYVAVSENRPIDEEVITLMKMALTGLIGIIAGYMGSKQMSQFADWVNQYGFPIVAAVALGYFIYYIWVWATTKVKPVINKAMADLIALVDRVRMLDNDMIRLEQKLMMVLEYKEELSLIHI